MVSLQPPHMMLSVCWVGRMYTLLYDRNQMSRAVLRRLWRTDFTHCENLYEHREPQRGSRGTCNLPRTSYHTPDGIGDLPTYAQSRRRRQGERLVHQQIPPKQVMPKSTVYKRRLPVMSPLDTMLSQDKPFEKNVIYPLEMDWSRLDENTNNITVMAVGFRKIDLLRESVTRSRNSTCSSTSSVQQTLCWPWVHDALRLRIFQGLHCRMLPRLQHKRQDSHLGLWKHGFIAATIHAEQAATSKSKMHFSLDMTIIHGRGHDVAASTAFEILGKND
ncbi:uncharacterized protein MYCGRDRAFT_94706 [Zymoseptoria tritici IPO323]|uniref:Uncharacterized protein n=1 Tax=Zymoseptoria tritici (strain CBS 115943 / IPO323) TaxID=336722 RepID=F9XGT3_ZYMTI|nr:uncharacterized protein MYCGRDRAFT_94706 [Zymoseptoria tritici IPO323]EGP85818.1 hypothetical protein MYCGRDRAFT_94706 [Zymoseptoria tritici IPO323]